MISSFQLHRQHSEKFDLIERTLRANRLLPGLRDHVAPSDLFGSPPKIASVTPMPSKPSPILDSNPVQSKKASVTATPASKASPRASVAQKQASVTTPPASKASTPALVAKASKRNATALHPDDEPPPKKAKKDKMAKKKVIRAYSGDPTDYNQPLRFPSEMTAEKQSNIELLHSALEELPNYQGVVVRGTNVLDMPFAEVQATGVYTNVAFMSSAKDRVCQSFFDTTYHLIIQSNTGKSIEKFVKTVYGHEKEVVFLPGKRFRVTKIEVRDGDRYSIDLEELA